MTSAAILADDPGGHRYEIEMFADDSEETTSRFTLDRERALEVAWKAATYRNLFAFVYERVGDDVPRVIARYL